MCARTKVCTVKPRFGSSHEKPQSSGYPFRIRKDKVEKRVRARLQGPGVSNLVRSTMHRKCVCVGVVFFFLSDKPGDSSYCFKSRWVGVGCCPQTLKHNDACTLPTLRVQTDHSNCRGRGRCASATSLTYGTY